MSEYTPGPWKWKDIPGAGIQISAVIPAGAKVGLHSYREDSDTETEGMLFTLRHPQRVQIADARWVQFSPKEWDDMQEANARLIAAAPDLLQACESAFESLKAAVESNVDVPGFDAEEHVVVKRLRAAIAKATGE